MDTPDQLAAQLAEAEKACRNIGWLPIAEANDQSKCDIADALSGLTGIADLSNVSFFQIVDAEVVNMIFSNHATNWAELYIILNKEWNDDDFAMVAAIAKIRRGRSLSRKLNTITREFDYEVCIKFGDIVDTIEHNKITGVCYDHDLGDPLIAFMKKPTDITFRDLINNVEYAASKTYSEALEYWYSEEAVVEDIEANDREFYEDGTLFTN